MQISVLLSVEHTRSGHLISVGTLAKLRFLVSRGMQTCSALCFRGHVVQQRIAVFFVQTAHRICHTLLLRCVKTWPENWVLQICLRHSRNCARVRCETFSLRVAIPPPPFLRLLSMPCCKHLCFSFLFCEGTKGGQKDCFESPV